MARRSDHSREELRDIILDSAWNIVGLDGVDGLSARRIAKDIGYAAGTIYNLYESMDDLIVHVNARTLDLMYDVLSSDKCNDSKCLPEDNMKTMADMYMGFASEYRPYWLMLFSYQLPDDRKSMDWYQEKVEGLFKPLEALVAPFYSDGSDKDKRVASRVLWASIHGLCFLQETGKVPVVSEGEGVPDMTEFLIDNFVRGVK